MNSKATWEAFGRQMTSYTRREEIEYEIADMRAKRDELLKSCRRALVYDYVQWVVGWT